MFVLKKKNKLTVGFLIYCYKSTKKEKKIGLDLIMLIYVQN